MPYILRDLDQKIVTFMGTEVTFLTGDNPLSFRKALIAICELSSPTRPGTGESIAAISIGQKLMDAKENEVEINKNQLILLKELLERQRIFEQNIVIAKLKNYLDQLDAGNPVEAPKVDTPQAAQNANEKVEIK